MGFERAVQLFFMGIIGEYIGAIYTQVKNRPLVIEKERINFDPEAKGKEIITEFFKFSTIYAGTFCLNLVLLPIFVEIGHIRPKTAAAIIILICIVFNYLGHSRFSFKQHNGE